MPRPGPKPPDPRKKPAGTRVPGWLLFLAVVGVVGGVVAIYLQQVRDLFPPNSVVPSSLAPASTGPAPALQDALPIVTPTTVVDQTPPSPPPPVTTSLRPSDVPGGRPPVRSTLPRAALTVPPSSVTTTPSTTQPTPPETTPPAPLETPPPPPTNEATPTPPPRLEPPQLLTTESCQGYYPPAAMAYQRGGHVGLRLTIDEQGQVVDVQVLKPMKPFTEAAVKCVRQWRYRPATRDGVPERSLRDVLVRFELEK
jgi:protein TonB